MATWQSDSSPNYFRPTKPVWLDALRPGACPYFRLSSASNHKICAGRLSGLDSPCERARNGPSADGEFQPRPP
eukprot:13973957-Alexandrium_andersonii.AAC.1